MKNVEKVQPLFFSGEEHEITLPSGKKVTIRETNGEDDGILSKIKNISDGAHLYNFLSGIIIKDHETGDKATPTDILHWLVNDKNYLLYKQRLINLGSELLITHICENAACKKKSEYTEDLSEMDGDLGQKNYTPSEKQIYKYQQGNARQIEMISSRNNKFQIDLLTGLIEKKDSDLPQDDRDVNQLLNLRNIKLFENGKWTPLYEFRRFPSKEMNELRGWVQKNDKTFLPVVSFTCPKCNTPYDASLFSMPVFFYPGAGI